MIGKLKKTFQFVFISFARVSNARFCPSLTLPYLLFLYISHRYVQSINFSQIPTNCLLLFLCRLNNDLKNEIAHKTKGLATHIKLVNSIRYSDLDVLDKVPAAILLDNSAKNTDLVNPLLSQLACVELVSKPSTDYNNSILCEAHENAFITLPTYITSDTKDEAEAEAEAEVQITNTHADDNQNNAQDAIENCDKQCVVVPAPSLEAAVTCIEKEVEVEQSAPCASGKEVRAFCLDELL